MVEITITRSHVGWFLTGMLLLILFIGWSFIMYQQGADNKPIRCEPNYVNQTTIIREPFPIDTTIRIEQTDGNQIIVRPMGAK